MGSRTTDRMEGFYTRLGTRIKNPCRTKAEKLAERNARAAKNKSLRARCGGLEARK